MKFSKRQLPRYACLFRNIRDHFLNNETLTDSNHFRRKRRASAITESEIEEKFQKNHSDELHTNNQTVYHKGHNRFEAEELFLTEYADIQYEDVTSMISSLEHLNLDHINFET